MAKVMLITGGARSGKSCYAQAQAESTAEALIYIATCPALDEEMTDRIRKHREDRAHRAWETLEVETALAAALADAPTAATVLVDCLTLWVNNLMYHAGEDLTERIIAEEAASVLQAAKARKGATYFVANEVGMGIVPDNALSRRYRDLAGRVNQVIAAQADGVILMVSGLPMVVK